MHFTYNIMIFNTYAVVNLTIKSKICKIESEKQLLTLEFIFILNMINFTLNIIKFYIKYHI